MDHQAAQERFSSYRDQELGPEETRSVEEHLQTCRACRRQYADFQETVASLGTLPPAGPPANFAEGVFERVRKRSHGRLFSQRRRGMAVPLEWLSLIMLVAVVAIYLLFRLSSPFGLFSK